jgi:hypothetical protein
VLECLTKSLTHEKKSCIRLKQKHKLRCMKQSQQCGTSPVRGGNEKLLGEWEGNRRVPVLKLTEGKN